MPGFSAPRPSADHGFAVLLLIVTLATFGLLWFAWADHREHRHHAALPYAKFDMRAEQDVGGRP